MAAPKREWFKAAEVCEVAEVQPYMLRSWEAEFPQLGQPPAGGGPRLYRQADVEMVLRIKSLVFGEGLTLAGARRRLDEAADSTEPPAGPGPRKCSASTCAIACGRCATACAGSLQMLSRRSRVGVWYSRRRQRRKRAGKSKRRGRAEASRPRDFAPVQTALSGCSAAWLARLLGVQEVPGSNPGIPTMFPVDGRESARGRLPRGLWMYTHEQERNRRSRRGHHRGGAGGTLGDAERADAPGRPAVRLHGAAERRRRTSRTPRTVTSITGTWTAPSRRRTRRPPTSSRPAASRA